jgi:signal transduction histidine kinase
LVRVGASWTAIAKPLRYAAVATIVILLVGGWLSLYFKARAVDLRAANGVLEGLRELKEIDSRWNDRLIAMRLSTAGEPDKIAAVLDMPRVARVQGALSVKAYEMGNLVSPQGLTALRQAFDEKASAIQQFEAAKSAYSQALDRFVQAGSALSSAARTGRDGIGAAGERAVERLSAATLAHLAQPASASEKIVAAAADALLAEDVPLGLVPQVQALAAASGAVVRAKDAEDAAFRNAFFTSTGPRLDSLTKEFERQFGNALDDAERYRFYLFVYSALILLLALWLAWRLGHTYRVIASINRQLLEANETLESRVDQRTRELADALKQLKENESLLIQSEKMSSLGQMVAGVAHEVNTPLAYVKASLDSVSGQMPRIGAALEQSERLIQMLQSEQTTEDELAAQFERTSSSLEEVRTRGTAAELGGLVKDGLHGIGQITELVSNLKNFARLDRSKVAKVDLNEGVASALAIARNELKTKTVHKEFSVLPPVSCAPSQINQVFLNLLTNAAQATPAQGGVIVVRTGLHGDGFVAVEVQDNGHGIPPDVLPKIFDPFFTTKEAGKGTGLGLSICYKIVASHGGRIDVASKPGVGTRFTVILPIEATEAMEPVPA